MAARLISFSGGWPNEVTVEKLEELERRRAVVVLQSSEPGRPKPPRQVGNTGASGSGRDCAFAVPGRDQAQNRAVEMLAVVSMLT